MKNYKIKIKIFAFCTEKNAIIFFSIILHFTFYILHIPKAYAQTYSVSLSPSLVQIVIKPGLSVTKDYKITNNGDPIVLTPKVSSFSVDPSSGTTSLIPASEASSAWFSLTDETNALDKPIFLNTNQSVTLPLKIAIPRETAPSDYYFILHLDSTASPDSNLTQTRIIASLGSNILITVSRLGTLNKNAQISQFSLPRLIDSFEELPVTIVLKNTGSAYFKPIGKVTLKGIFLQANYKILPQNILVGTRKMLLTENIYPSYPGLQPEGLSKQVRWVDTETNRSFFSILSNKTAREPKSTLLLRGFHIGPYSLTIDLVPDGTTIQIKKTVYFFAFPYKTIIILLVIFYFCKKGYQLFSEN